MTLTKEKTQGYWVDDESIYKVKIYVSEDRKDLLAKIRWEEEGKQKQYIFAVNDKSCCVTAKQTAQQAIDMFQDRQELVRRVNDY